MDCVRRRARAKDCKYAGDVLRNLLESRGEYCCEVGCLKIFSLWFSLVPPPSSFPEKDILILVDLLTSGLTPVTPYHTIQRSQSSTSSNIEAQPAKKAIL